MAAVMTAAAVTAMATPFAAVAVMATPTAAAAAAAVVALIDAAVAIVIVITITLAALALALFVARQPRHHQQMLLINFVTEYHLCINLIVYFITIIFLTHVVLKVMSSTLTKCPNLHAILPHIYKSKRACMHNV